VALFTLLPALVSLSAPACSDQTAADSGGAAPGALVFEGTPPRNVLMISLETLRRDAVGFYGGEGPDTPFLDGLLAGGVALEDHRSCSNWTYLSALCALSGSDGLTLGFLPGGSESNEPLPGDVALLVDRLAEAGYSTGLVTTNAFIGSISGMDARFGVFDERDEAPAEETTEATLAALEALEPPWFLHAHFFDPHLRYTPPDEYLGELDALPPSPVDLVEKGVAGRIGAAWDGLSEEDRETLLAHLDARYRGEVAYLDDQLERLFTELDARGALEDTLVVLWSDHGEQLFEHGDFTHGRSLHVEETAAVAGFLAPGLAPARWSQPTTHADLAPTVLDALGLPPGAIGGAPLGASDAGRALFLDHRGTDVVQQAVVQDGWKLIYRWDGALTLYEAAADPGEQSERSAAEPERMAALWAALAPRVERLDELAAEASPVIPEGLDVDAD
jgi:arylsulfatase A-like enzyme